MAKAGIDIGVSVFSRRDPVSGTTKTFLRTKHSRQTSTRLKGFQKCVADAMRGKSIRGGSPDENARALRSAFSNAAKSCRVGR